MKLISCEKLEKSMVELQFSIDAETFKSAVNTAFKREGKKYAIPGFRKGKAPKAMIEKMYGKDLFQYDAINDLFPENYEAAVKEAGIEVVGRPEPEEGATLKVKVAVKPEVELGEYTGLTVNKDVKTVDEADVDAEIKRMQDRNGRLLTREGEAQNGDTVDIDFEGFVDGVAFEGGKAEHYSLVLGSGSFIPGFEEQVVGHKAGEEFDVNVKFPEEYQAEELAGKDATFKIKLHEVKYKELPELDDDFAKDVSEYDTLEELKDSIRKGIQTNHEKQAEQSVENDLIDQVVNGMKADIPDAMIESRIEELVQDFQYRISQQGLKLEQYLQYMGMTMDQFKEQFREQADKQVKMRLAMEAIVAKESIEATEEEFEAEIKRIADAYQMEADKVKSLVDAAAVKKDLAVNKAIDFVKEKANIVLGAAEEKKPAKKTTRKTTKKAAAKKDEEPKEEEKGE
ncbi:MAG: trigger factor [Subdoligranulum variabile]|nr:trigger factor [Subdoligranulum variabile]